LTAFSTQSIAGKGSPLSSNPPAFATVILSRKHTVNGSMCVGGRALIAASALARSFVCFGPSFYFGLHQTSPSAINVMKVIPVLCVAAAFGSLFTFRRSMHFEHEYESPIQIQTPECMALNRSAHDSFSISINCLHTLNFSVSASWHRYSCRLPLFVSPPQQLLLFGGGGSGVGVEHQELGTEAWNTLVRRLFQWKIVVVTTLRTSENPS